MGPVVEARDTQGEKVRGRRTLQTLEVDREEGLRIRKSGQQGGRKSRIQSQEQGEFQKGKRDQLRDQQQSKKFRKAASPGDSCFKELRLNSEYNSHNFLCAYQMLGTLIDSLVESSH